MVTDHIDSFDATGIKLKSGKHLDADVIVTAAGLNLAFAGKIAVSVDGKPVEFRQPLLLPQLPLFSNVPNLAACSAISTPAGRSGPIVGEYITRLLKQMDMARSPPLRCSRPMRGWSLTTSSPTSPRATSRAARTRSDQPAWPLNQDYKRDKQDMRHAPIEHGVMHFTRARELVGG